MWLIHTETGEEGWHICQQNQNQTSDLLVFIKEGGHWKTKLWKSTETHIRAKNHTEHLADASAMSAAGFFVPKQFNF